MTESLLLSTQSSNNCNTPNNNTNNTHKRSSQTKTTTTKTTNTTTTTNASNNTTNHNTNAVISTHRTAPHVLKDHIQSIAWMFVLPTAAVITTDVWFPEHLSFAGIDMQLAVLNMTGAFMDGFFAQFEALSRGGGDKNVIITATLALIADDVRGFFLSTYTSWAGMVLFAATLAQEHGSIRMGMGYILLSVLCGMVAHALGSLLAQLVASLATKAAAATSSRKRTGGNNNNNNTYYYWNKFANTTVTTTALLLGLVAYSAISFLLVVKNFEIFHPVFLTSTGQEEHASLPSLISFLNVDEHRLFIAIIFSIAGAFIGNLVGNYVDEWYSNNNKGSSASSMMIIPRGTLVCNTLFTLLALSLHVLTLRHGAYWQRSVLLQTFSGSFCGAASAFAGHASDNMEIYHAKKSDTKGGDDNKYDKIQIQSKKNALLYTLENIVVHSLFALVLFYIAFQLEYLNDHVTMIDVNGDGIVEIPEIQTYYYHNNNGEH